MRYTLADIRHRFDAAAFTEGQGFVESDSIREIESADHGQIISGRIRARNGSTYRTQVQLRDDALRFSSRCECSQRKNCAHAVALLLAALKQAPQSGLSPAVSTWVDDLFALHEQSQSETPRPENNRLRFECHLPEHPEPHVAVNVCRQGLNQSPGKPLSLNGRWHRGNIRHPADRSLFNRLRAYADESPYTARLSEAGSGELFEEMVREGQLYWNHDRVPLKPGQPRAAVAHWTVHGDGSQSLGLYVADGVEVLPLEPPLYVDRQKHRVGQITTELSSTLLPLLGSSPRIAPGQIEEFTRLLDARGLKGVPRPKNPKIRILKTRKPTAHLELMHIDDLLERRDGFVPDIYVARMQTCYGDYCFVPNRGETECLRREDGGLIQINRDLTAERALLDQLPDFHELEAQNTDDQGPLILTPYDGSVAWVQFLDSTMPDLQQQGWSIDMRDSFDLRVLEGENWQVHAELGEHDWFELSAGFDIAGERHNLLELLVRLLQDTDDPDELLRDPHRPLIVQLAPGRMLRLPRERIETVLQTLTELYREKPLNRAGRLRLHRLDAARLENWNANWDWQVPDQLRSFARSLQQTPAEIPLPDLFQGQLRGYQAAGLRWMQNLARHGLGGILADDMGLGKTVQTLAHLACLYAESNELPSLIVAPTSVIGNWRAEASRFTPELEVLLWHGKSRQPGALRRAALVITSYATLLRDAELLQGQSWRVLVLDEAQYIKNPRAKISGCVRKLRADQRLCLSGTPMENHLGELWSLFDFLAPGFLADARSFRQLYRTPIEKDKNQTRAQQLADRIRPFLLRRCKDEVARDLPAKSEIIRTITLDEEQAALYESVRVAMEQRIRQALASQGLARSQLLILDALLKLRQICCDPRLVKLEQARGIQGSAKLTVLLDMLVELTEEGRRILLFSQFTEMLDLIETAVRQLKIPYLKLTGASSNRQDLVDQFQTGQIPLFLISLKAGGTGLNLTAADTVIHYDPWWNPAVENQATDRAHRIGQDKPVFVYKLLCENTVEERIQQMQQRKQALSDTLYQGNISALASEDLDWMLEPA